VVVRVVLALASSLFATVWVGLAGGAQCPGRSVARASQPAQSQNTLPETRLGITPRRQLRSKI